MSLDNDKSLIKKIIPYYKDSNFNEHFDHITRDLTKSRRFLVKMEINRLYNDCVRNIDLRGRVDGQCSEYPYEDLTHYLDDVALNVFEESLSIYGKYTIGVFEEVTNTKNTYREQQQKQDAARRSDLQKKSTSNVGDTSITPEVVEQETVIPHNFAQKISLTNINPRAEERINILTRVKVRMANGRAFHALTTNMSVRGTKIKSPNSYNIAIGDTIYVDYVDIEQKLEEKLSLELAYQVLDVQINNGQQIFNLSRIHYQEDIDNVLNNFIKKERRSTATDVEHIIEAVRSLGFQYIHLNKLVGLPIFFEKPKDQYQALFALSNFENKPILNYWRTHNNLLRINSLCSHQRISELLARNQPEIPTLLFCFTHVVKGRKYFYSATEEELKKAGLTDLFMQFGASKDSWKVYQLYANDVNNYEWHLPDVLPQHLILKEQSTLEQHKHLLKLHDLEAMAYLLDISDNANIPLYQSRQPADSKINQLQQFGHKDANDIGLKLIETNEMTMSNRREDRFTYQTKVIIHNKRKQYVGTTIDFSVHGIQVKLTDEIEVSKGDILDISIPLFNKAGKKEENSLLNYEVMRISSEGKILNLKISVTPDTEYGPKAVYRIAKGNQHKLTAQIAPPANFTKSLILLYCHYLSSLVIILSKVQNNYKISHIVTPQQHNNLYNLFSVLSPYPTHCDMSAISQNNTFKELFLGALKQLSANSSATAREVYIQLINEGETGGYRTLTHYFEDFKTPQEHSEFISSALKEGQLFALRIIMSRSPAMNYKAFSREIIYAAKQASFKTRQLQAEFDAVVATAEIIDIMDEVKQRFNCL
jgi:hypothetical protein